MKLFGAEFFIILSMALIVVVVVLLLMLLFRLRNDKSRRGETWDSFFLRDGELVINTLIQRPVFKLEDIDRVEFYCRYRRGYFGQYRIFEKSGKKSRGFMFDASVYTRHMQLWSNREDIVKAIEKMRMELQQAGICAEYSGD